MSAKVHDGLEQAAITVMSRAVKYDEEGKYSSALACYQEGIQLCLDAMKTSPDKHKAERFRQKVEGYIARAEHVKELVKQQKDSGNYHDQIQIPNDGVGFSYESLFSKYMGKNIKKVEIEDPYIRNVHQAYNFLSFCELLVRFCPQLKQISLITGPNQQDLANQKSRLDCIGRSLASHDVQLEIKFSDTLHDREIRLSNGWIFKIGRGLDFFKPASKFTIGFTDQNLRPCHETTVDIFFKQ